VQAKVPFGLSMLAWALDEEANVGAFVERAERTLADVTDDFEVVLIDDGSTDATWALASELARTRPWLRLYRNDRNRGSGYCAKRALSLGTKDYLFWQTVDWAYDIGELMSSLPLLRQYDILQGVRGNALELRSIFALRSDSAYKGVVSYVNYRLIRVLFGLPISDYQNVTIYPRRLIQGIALESESSFINPECLLKTWWQGASFKEIHVGFVKRERGTGKGTRPRAIAAAIGDIARYWYRWVVRRRCGRVGRGQVVQLAPLDTSHGSSLAPTLK
jgi:glycosyltransferase involved in cell wall biosynthesis